MGTPTMVLLALGLAMDAFAVSIANGIGARGRALKTALGCGAAFALFQVLMPLAGYLAGHSFLSLISRYDHWVAALLLGLIGGRMVLEGLHGQAEAAPRPGGRRLTFRLLTLQAVATSIDALAVGVGLGVIRVNLPLCLLLIGGITFGCCFAGVFIGRRFGARFSGRAELAGGVVLLLIGLRILLGHLLA